jgi:hypothetical protein
MRISCAGFLLVSAGMFLLIVLLSCLTPICRSVLFFTCDPENKPTAKGANGAGSEGMAGGEAEASE